MKWLLDLFKSSVGKKFLIAFTGFFLILFLLVHLYGNLLLLKNDNGAAFLAYAEAFLKNPILRAIEILLFVGLILHIIYAVTVTIQNQNARPVRYAVQKSAKGSTWFSRNMRHSGTIIFIFLGLHLKAFFFDHRILEKGGTMYDTAIAAFSNPYWVGFYLFCMALLSFHLVHGFQSAFQSLGLRHDKYTIFIKIFGYLYAAIVPTGFAIIPLYIYNANVLRLL